MNENTCVLKQQEIKDGKNITLADVTRKDLYDRRSNLTAMSIKSTEYHFPFNIYEVLFTKVLQLLACNLIYDEPLILLCLKCIQNRLLSLCSRNIFCFTAKAFSFPLGDIKVFTGNHRLFIPFGLSVYSLREGQRHYVTRSLIIGQICIWQ